MALTREERLAMQKAIKRIRKLEMNNEALQLRVNELQAIIDKMGSANDMDDWTSAQWDAFLRPFILRYQRHIGGVSEHDHLNDTQGGDCFAKLGANLVE